MNPTAADLDGAEVEAACVCRGSGLRPAPDLLSISVVRRRLLCGTLLGLLSGCMHYPDTPVPLSMKLRVGMTYDEVVALLERPRAVEMYGAVEFWLYPADAAEKQGPFLPVGFIGGRVAGWGRDYYDSATGGRIGADGSIPRG